MNPPDQLGPFFVELSFSVFIPQSKDIDFRLAGDFKWAIGVNMCLYVLVCD